MQHLWCHDFGPLQAIQASQACVGYLLRTYHQMTSTTDRENDLGPWGLDAFSARLHNSLLPTMPLPSL